MPRVTNHAHIARYRALRRVWLEHQSWFRYASARSQGYLHDYYQPSLELTDEQVVAHRREITKRRPALPQQAGRAYYALGESIIQGASEFGAVTTVYAKPGRKTRQITVSALVKPTIDAAQFARVLRGLAAEMASDEASRSEGESGRRAA